MPIVDAGFVDEDNRTNGIKLEAYGPTLEVTVSHSQASDIHVPKSKTVYALVDTGACETCIDEKLAIDLGLPIVDVRVIAGAGGAKDHNVYMGHVHIPQLDIIQYGKFTGVNLKEGGQEHECLLGRSFLRNVIMIYDGLRAQVTLASAKQP